MWITGILGYQLGSPRAGVKRTVVSIGLSLVVP